MSRPVQFLKGEKNVLGLYEFLLDENVLAAIKALASYMGYAYQEDASYLWLLPSEPRVIVQEQKATNLGYALS